MIQARTQPKLPFKKYPIPNNIKISYITSNVNIMNRKLNKIKRWEVDQKNHLLFVPQDTDSEIVESFINETKNIKIDDDTEICYDYYLCCKNESVLATNQIVAYNENESFIVHDFCITCAYEIYETLIDRFFDLEKNQPKMEMIIENREFIRNISPLSHESSNYWPLIPLGQMLFALTSVPELNKVVRTWMSAVIFNEFHSSELIHYCPQHPAHLMRVDNNNKSNIKCSVKECSMIYCIKCKKWHKNGNCNFVEFPIVQGCRICPSCKVQIEKSESSNHIHCKICGKHFCYYCGWGPTDDSCSVYAHLSEEHGNCYNNPPDYRKNFRHEMVSEDELQKFYQKYPQLKPEY